MSATRAARLLRWLGPWTDTSLVPEGIVRREIEIRTGNARSLRARIWRRDDEAPSGSLLLVPGLHYLGPEDVRFDRLARVLAKSGLLVLAPFLPDFSRLVVAPRVIDDTIAAFDALRSLPDAPRARPGVFSISFGSLPALRLCAARGDAVARLIVFGGFADLARTFRFALCGDGDSPNDPLNAPVAFIQLVDHLGVDPGDRDLLCDAWRAQCVRTWGREESKREEVYRGVARELASGLPARAREIFLAGCRAIPGTEDLALRALERAGSAFEWVDPRPHLGGLRCAVDLVHGRDDDVIPCSESAALLAAMPPHVRARRHLTGLYGHTSSSTRRSGPRGIAGDVRAVLDEVASLTAILGAIAAASSRDHAR
jgi:pimeloyl-ACP methyl ester carboxylesterase